MPGGNNPYTRPANKPERAAMKRQSARDAAIKNIKQKREENIVAKKTTDEFTRDLDRLLAMEGMMNDASRDDRQILSNMKRNASDRKANMFKMKKGGAVRGYEGGGEVCRGNGRAFQGKAKRVQVR